MRRSTWVVGLVVVASLAGAAPARSATNPAAVLITVRCGVIGAAPPGDSACSSVDLDPKNKNGSVLNGSVEVLSGGVVIATETSPQIFVHHDPFDQGTVTVVATGNNNPVLFDAWYGSPASSVLTAPDITVKVWVTKNGRSTLAIHQRYAPAGSSLWSAHSEDTAVETARAKAAEAALSAAINGGDLGLQKAINAETARAKLAEATLQGALDAEVIARQTDVFDLRALLATEIADRRNADGLLQNQINLNAADAKNALAMETARALSAEGAEATRAKNAEAALQLALDSEVAARKQGDIDALASAKLYADAKVAVETALRQAAIATLSNGLNAEVARAQQAETALRAALDAEIVRAGSAEFTLRTDLAAEVARAQAAEAALLAGLNGGQAALQAALAAETARAQAAEAALGNDLAAEILRAKGAEAAVAADLAAEITRAKASEDKKANVTLDNLSAVAINASLLPNAPATLDVGEAAKGWRTLHLANADTADAGINFQPSGGGKATVLSAAPASAARSVKLPDASGTVAVSASGNIALDAAGNITFTGTLPVASGGTNNNSFAAGKFVAYDGSKLASTGFDSSSFAASNASVTVATGAGLAGGGVLPLGGAITLSIPPLGVSNAMLQNASVTVNAGSGLSGGGAVALGGSITLANAGVTSLGGGGGITVSAANGAVLLGSAQGGDVGGTVDAATVVGLQGRSVSAAAPANGQVLAWNGATWEPTSAGGLGGGVTGGGVVNALARWTGAASIGASAISDNGNVITLSPLTSTTFASGSVIAQSGVVARGGITNDGGTLTLGASNATINAVINTLQLNARTALSDLGDGWLRLNHAGSYGSGVYSPGFLRADGGITSGGAGSLGGGTMLATSQMQTPVLYDYNDTSYFVDPNSTSRLGNLRFNTADCLNGFCPANGAIRFTPNFHLNSSNGNAVIVNWDNGALPGNNTQQLRIGNGQGGDAFYFTSAGYAIGSYINTTDNVIGSGVTGMMVKQGDNYHRTANAAAVDNFVLKACGASNAGPSCTSYENLGNAGWGYAATFSGALPSGGSSEHWYRVTFTTSGGGNTGSYRPHVYLNGGQAYYTIDVFADDCSTKLSCGTEANTVSVNLDNWETIQQDVGVGDLSNASGMLTVPYPGAGGAIRVRVRPYTDAASAGCTGYALVIRNDGN